MDTEKQLVFLLDDEKDVMITLSKSIKHHTGGIELISFSDTKEFLKHPKLHKADLYIMDIRLAQEDGREVCAYLHEDKDMIIPCLFISAWHFDDKAFEMLESNCVFDFILKPFNNQVFLNRIKVLLRHSAMMKEIRKTDEQRQLELEKLVFEKTQQLNKQLSLRKESDNLLKKVESAIWETFNYSNLYTIILNGDMKIKLANWSMAKMLGFDSEDNLIGLDWMQFVSKHEKKVVRYALEKMYNRDLDYREISFDVVSKTGEIISVKWFNSYINDKFHGVFSIGIPLTKKITADDHIDSVRAYYQDIVEKDRTTIQSIKQMALEKRSRLDIKPSRLGEKIEGAKFGC